MGTHQAVVAARAFQEHGTVADEEGVLLLQQRQRSLQKRVVVGVLDVDAHHLGEQRRLRTVQVVATSAIRDESDRLDEIQKVLDDVLRNLGEGTLGAQQALDDPEGIPVIGLAEPAAGDDEGAVDGQEGRETCGAVPNTHVAPGQVRPDVDYLGHELGDGGAVDVVQKVWLRRQFIGGHGLELAAGFSKVLGEEVVQRRVVPDRFFELVEGLENLVKGPRRRSAPVSPRTPSRRGGCAYRSTNVLESSNGLASSMPRRRSP